MDTIKSISQQIVNPFLPTANDFFTGALEQMISITNPIHTNREVMIESVDSSLSSPRDNNPFLFYVRGIIKKVEAIKGENMILLEVISGIFLPANHTPGELSWFGVDDIVAWGLVQDSPSNPTQTYYNFDYFNKPNTGDYSSTDYNIWGNE